MTVAEQQHLTTDYDNGKWF